VIDTEWSLDDAREAHEALDVIEDMATIAGMVR